MSCLRMWSLPWRKVDHTSLSYKKGVALLRAFTGHSCPVVPKLLTAAVCCPCIAALAELWAMPGRLCHVYFKLRVMACLHVYITSGAQCTALGITCTAWHAVQGPGPAGIMCLSFVALCWKGSCLSRQDFVRTSVHAMQSAACKLPMMHVSCLWKPFAVLSCIYN